jgi:predicted Zn-dependent protease
MSRGPATHAALKETMQKDPRAFLQLAEEHRRMGRLKEAIAICLEGLEQHPNLHAASITLGRSYLESGKLDEARTILEGVCARLPEHHLAAKLLAETQCRLGDLASAVATCKAILVHYPRDREFETMLAEIVAEQERPAPAAGAAAGALRGAPDPLPVRCNALTNITSPRCRTPICKARIWETPILKEQTSARRTCGTSICGTLNGPGSPILSWPISSG